MQRKESTIISKLRGKLIVSCQDYVEPMIKAALLGGARGLRVNSPMSVRLAKSMTDIPVLACNKMYFPNSSIYITPSIKAALKIIEAGADLVALDCTNRKRARQSPGEIIKAIHNEGALAVADLSNISEAEDAVKAGADILATTLHSGFDINFIKALTEFGKPVLAEGCITNPEQASMAIDAGAWSVCVGSAITRPHLLTENFVKFLGE